jgi:hypothetical protein
MGFQGTHICPAAQQALDKQLVATERAADKTAWKAAVRESGCGNPLCLRPEKPSLGGFTPRAWLGLQDDQRVIPVLRLLRITCGQCTRREEGNPERENFRVLERNAQAEVLLAQHRARAERERIEAAAAAEVERIEAAAAAEVERVKAVERERSVAAVAAATLPLQASLGRLGCAGEDLLRVSKRITDSIDTLVAGTLITGSATR